MVAVFGYHCRHLQALCSYRRLAQRQAAMRETTEINTSAYRAFRLREAGWSSVCASVAPSRSHITWAGPPDCQTWPVMRLVSARWSKKRCRVPVPRRPRRHPPEAEYDCQNSGVRCAPAVCVRRSAVPPGRAKRHRDCPSRSRAHGHRPRQSGRPTRNRPSVGLTTRNAKNGSNRYGSRARALLYCVSRRRFMILSVGIM